MIPKIVSSVHFSSVAQSCPTLCNPMDCSIPGFPIHHQLPKLAETQVHQVGDVIQEDSLLLTVEILKALLMKSRIISHLSLKQYKEYYTILFWKYQVRKKIEAYIGKEEVKSPLFETDKIMIHMLHSNQ